MMYKIIHNVETGEVVEVQLNEEEKTLRALDESKFFIEYEKEKAEDVKAKAAKSALLEKLGITEEEAKLLLS